ncbi:MAG TPA: prepilin peptidase [Stellaceae bacterium]|nr:prepilin peptidase [Stellaceae bacterium]
MIASIGGEIALAVYVFLLVMAALSDGSNLRIPNWLTASLAAVFPAAALAFGHQVDWLSHFAAALAVFAGAAMFFALRLMGGGDVKLLAAVALWTGLHGVVPFLAVTAVIGGLMALVQLLLRRPMAQVTLLAVLHRLPAIAQRGSPIPYGIPIAAAGILMVPSFSFFT